MGESSITTAVKTVAKKYKKTAESTEEEQFYHILDSLNMLTGTFFQQKKIREFSFIGTPSEPVNGQLAL